MYFFQATNQDEIINAKFVKFIYPVQQINQAKQFKIGFEISGEEAPSYWYFQTEEERIKELKRLRKEIKILNLVEIRLIYK